MMWGIKGNDIFSDNVIDDLIVITHSPWTRTRTRTQTIPCAIKPAAANTNTNANNSVCAKTWENKVTKKTFHCGSSKLTSKNVINQSTKRLWDAIQRALVYQNLSHLKIQMHKPMQSNQRPRPAKHEASSTKQRHYTHHWRRWSILAGLSWP